MLRQTRQHNYFSYLYLGWLHNRAQVLHSQREWFKVWEPKLDRVLSQVLTGKHFYVMITRAKQEEFLVHFVNSILKTDNSNICSWVKNLSTMHVNKQCVSAFAVIMACSPVNIFLYLIFTQFKAKQKCSFFP